MKHKGCHCKLLLLQISWWSYGTILLIEKWHWRKLKSTEVSKFLNRQKKKENCMLTIALLAIYGHLYSMPTKPTFSNKNIEYLGILDLRPPALLRRSSIDMPSYSGYAVAVHDFWTEFICSTNAGLLLYGVLDNMEKKKKGKKWKWNKLKMYETVCLVYRNIQNTAAYHTLDVMTALVFLFIFLKLSKHITRLLLYRTSFTTMNSSAMHAVRPSPITHSWSQTCKTPTGRHRDW